MKKIQTNSLKWQLFTRFFIILILLLVIMEIFQYGNMKQYLFQSKEQILDARFHNMNAAEMKKFHSDEDLINGASDIINMTIDTNMGAAVIDRNGNIIKSQAKGSDRNQFGKNKSDDKAEIPQEPVSVSKLSSDTYKQLMKQKGSLEGYRLVKDENNNLQIVGFRKIGNLDAPIGLIQLNVSGISVQNTLNRQLYFYIIACSLVVVIAAVVGGMVFKYTLKPLYNMTSMVEQINVGQLDRRLPLENKQLEIDSLARAFNNMLERLEQSFKQEQLIKEKMRQFVSDASHELRTPLTSIRGFVEVLLRGAAKSEQQLNSALNTILKESERLGKLVNDLLMLTRLDQRNAQEMKIENISAIIAETLPQLKILADNRNINAKLEENVFAYVNGNQIKQVIFNLVQNAICHTDENKGEISISTKHSSDFAVIEISDNGSGISSENLNKIFDRFFRSEEHRARKYGGYGLGLSIVKAIVDAHEGKIEVTSELEKGTKFSVYLKLKNVERI